jgi:hypothetical protein
MYTRMYDDPFPELWDKKAVFLAGPTARYNNSMTPWRAEALRLLSKPGACPTETVVVIPEFRVTPTSFDAFQEAARCRFDDGQPATIPGMRRVTEKILEWETKCIDRSGVLLVWMPFSDELPGRTTRCEVSRALAMMAMGEHLDLVLGMPPGTDASGHIRYHAHQVRVKIHDTLEECCQTVKWYLEH